MNSRPLLDYLMDQDSDRHDQPSEVEQAPEMSRPARRIEVPDLPPLRHRESANSLAAQIGAILNRRDRLPSPLVEQPAPLRARQMQSQPMVPDYAEQLAASEPRPIRQPEPAQVPEPERRPARIVMDAPPMIQDHGQGQSQDQDDFAKFAEAVRLIGQAARRFAEPDVQPAPAPVQAAPVQQPQVISTSEISLLTDALREAINAFRHVADDLAVSAGEIRRHATRPFESPVREQPVTHRRSRQQDEDIADLREALETMQERLDALSQGRRRARY